MTTVNSEILTRDTTLDEISDAILLAKEGNFLAITDLPEDTEFGFVLDNGTVANIAVNAIKIQFGSCGGRARAVSSYPPGQRVVFRYNNLRERIVPPIARVALQ